MKRSKTARIFTGFLVFAAAVFLLIRLALYDGLAVRRYTVETDLVMRSHRFVLITDLHATVYGEKQEILVKKILTEQPEAVFLSGDIADDKRGFEGCAMLLERLREKQIPMYYVPGNHECWLEWSEDICAVFAEYGVTDLCGSQADLGDNIRLTGIADPVFHEDTMAYMTALSVPETGGAYYDILLAHRPEFAETYVQAGYELTLAGHAHGGQVRLPLILNGLYAPNQGWFPKYAGGKYKLSGGSLIVSRGLMLDDLPRIFNPPEIVVVEVKSE